MLSDPNLVIFYVDNPMVSARFYERLLGHQPVESSPTFVLFVLKSGSRLGLWSRHTVEPATTVSGGGTELAFQVDTGNKVDELHAIWQRQAINIVQPPVKMSFGYTFTALDPDNHRLRVFALQPE
ncbi:VOC family protein [Legionella spiritensis]|uniref:Bleomycin resistance protein n=1 Tax=Legionella spiritensis TaxID=452 RepID=A0A0W0YWB4_LEGSP|nr:VOC family protein [Legionella spiritensis]KTD61159.1 bleomycin resistance protein [Legionella spiritensis]SNV45283.1 bleomycin resistance protein [Legionella spiritensis]